jgi:hypothetical protein
VRRDALEVIDAVEQQAALRSAGAFKRLGALDLRAAAFDARVTGVLGGLGEHQRDILKLREEVNCLTGKSTSHEIDILKNCDTIRRIEDHRVQDEAFGFSVKWFQELGNDVEELMDYRVRKRRSGSTLRGFKNWGPNSICSGVTFAIASRVS